MARTNLIFGYLIDEFDCTNWDTFTTSTLYPLIGAETDAEVRTKIDTLNSNGGALLWCIPPSDNRYFNAYSPIVFKAKACEFAYDLSNIPEGLDYDEFYFGGGRGQQLIGPYYMYYPSTSEEVQLNVLNESGDTISALTANAFRGMASFDVAPIVRTIFGSGIEENDFYDFFGSKPEPMLYAVFSVNISGDAIKYLCVNGVNNAGQNNGGNFLKSATSKVLTNPQELIVWVNQEWDGDIQLCDNAYPEVTMLYQSGQSEANAEKSRRAYRIPIFTEAMFNNYGLANLGFTFRIADLSACSPMVVRWLNNKGGMEQKVFFNHQFRAQSSQTSSLREVYTEGLKGENGNERAYAINHTDKITLGAEGLAEQEYERLMTMISSPFIEWLDTSSKFLTERRVGEVVVSASEATYPRWFAVSVDKFDGTKDYGSKSYSFEITLKLPKRDSHFG